MNRQQAIKLLTESIVEAIRKRGEEAFVISLQKVPVITGALRNSGYEINIDNGMELGFGKPYASSVERGWSGGTINVPTYRKSKGTIVRAYSYFSPPREGQHFIEKSMTESFSKLNEEFDSQLRQRFRKVRKV